MVVFQALLHGLSHVYAYIREYGAELGWSSVRKDIAAGEFITYGFVALVCLIIILIQSTSVVRHAFYETFKIAHIVLVSVIIAMLYFHMDMHDMPQIKSIYTIISIWVVERIIRCARVVYRNVGNGGTSALVEALPDGACRLTVDMARPWTFKAGQHAYLYMPGLSWLQSHPFSVAWSEEVDTMHEEKNSITHHDVLAKRKAKMCFIIRARTGFTHNLFKLAEAANGQKIAVRCMLEGPYGALHSMHSYGTVLLFAGGVGITHQVPFVRDLVTGYANGTVAARKIVLVWTIKQGSHLEWIRPWMTSILQLDRRRECLKIQLFISRPGSNKEVHSPSATVQMFPGRPNIPAIMDCEMETQIGTMGVSVCGPGAFSDDVRSAVRQRQHTRNVEFVEEAFTW